MIYVTDPSKSTWQWGPMCILTADTPTELDQAAHDLGLHPSWANNLNHPNPFMRQWMITTRHRRIALRIGAQAVTRRQLAGLTAQAEVTS